jgi:magnesium-transporting ATPase (P-type)
MSYTRARACLDPRLHADVDSSDPHVWQFFRALALCNTVVPTVESSIDVDTLVYKSSSPDEEALVKAARDAKFTFRERKLTTLVMEAPDLTLEKFEVRSSCITVRHQVQTRLTLWLVRSSTC